MNRWRRAACSKPCTWIPHALTQRRRRQICSSSSRQNDLLPSLETVRKNCDRYNDTHRQPAFLAGTYRDHSTVYHGLRFLKIAKTSRLTQGIRVIIQDIPAKLKNGDRSRFIMKRTLSKSVRRQRLVLFHKCRPVKSRSLILSPVRPFLSIEKFTLCFATMSRYAILTFGTPSTASSRPNNTCTNTPSIPSLPIACVRPSTCMRC